MKPELDLDTMLRDPIVRLMMARDGIESGDVRQIFQKVRSARSLQGRGIEAAPNGPRKGGVSEAPATR